MRKGHKILFITVLLLLMIVPSALAETNISVQTAVVEINIGVTFDRIGGATHNGTHTFVHVLNNNTIGVYDSTNNKIFESKANSTTYFYDGGIYYISDDDEIAEITPTRIVFYDTALNKLRTEEHNTHSYLTNYGIPKSIIKLNNKYYMTFGEFNSNNPSPYIREFTDSFSYTGKSFNTNLPTRKDCQTVVNPIDCAITLFYDDVEQLVYANSNYVGATSKLGVFSKTYNEAIDYTGYNYLGFPLSISGNPVNVLRNNQTHLFTTEYGNRFIFSHKINNPITIPNYFYFNGKYYSYTQCVDNNNVCANNTEFTLLYGGTTLGLSCPVDNISYCTLSCEDTQLYDSQGNIYYTQGSCVQDDSCTNECNINGLRECRGTNTYVQCGLEYQQNNCYTFSVPITCPSNEYCDQGYCIPFSATASNQTIQYPQWYLYPQTTDTTKTDYTINEVSDSIEVITTNSVHVQNFTIQTTLPVTSTTYFSANCDYDEEQIVNDTITTNNRVELEALGWSSSQGDFDILTINNDYVISFKLDSPYELTRVFTPQTSNTRVNTKFNFYDDDEKQIDLAVFLGDLTDNNGYIIFDRDAETQKTLRVYHSNSSFTKNDLILEDVSYNTYDDLENIELSFIIDYVGGFVQYEFTINRVSASTTYYSRPFSFEGNPLATHSITYNLENTTKPRGYVESVEVINIPSNSGYNTVTRGKPQGMCAYTTTGCRTARIYHSATTIPVFNDYEEQIICVQKLSALDIEQDFGTQLGENLTQREKWYVVIGSFVLIYLLFLGFVASSGEKENFPVAMTVATIINFALIIFFVTIQFIPAWFLVLMGLLSAGVVMIFIRKTVNPT